MKEISVDELKVKLDNKEQSNILDVREEAEHNDFNIGGINFPLSRIKKMDIAEIEHLKNDEIICYCQNGKNSNDACLMLEYMGFANTFKLTGGLREWEDKFGYE